MSTNHFLRNLTHQHQLLKRLPARYAPPLPSFIRSTTRQIFRHHLRTRSKRPMHPLNHTLFLSRSLNLSGSPKVGPLNLGPSRLRLSQQKLRILPMHPARSRSLRGPLQRHDRMLPVHLIYRLKADAQRSAIPPLLSHLIRLPFKRARGATSSRQGWLRAQISILDLILER
jgi:hypothetical protein